MTTRIYRVKRSQLVVAIVILLFGLIFLGTVSIQVLVGNKEADWAEILISLLISLVAGVFVIRALADSVSLSNETIELRSFGQSTVLPLNKIKGRRRYVSRGDEEVPAVTHLVLEPNDDRCPRLDIEEIYAFDDYFYAWFESLKDLDKLDQKRTVAVTSSSARP